MSRRKVRQRGLPVTMPARFLFRMWVALGLSLLAVGARAQEAPFKVGVAPHTSARGILELYSPLRVHLEKALGRPVEILTAPDFTEFARRAVAQEYDLAITTGHQARLLEVDARYGPLLTYKASFKSLVIVAANGRIRRPQDLKGTTVIGLSGSSLVTLWGQHWLRRMGLGEVPVRYVSAADSVAQLLLRGEGSAGFVSLPNFQHLDPEVQAGLRILVESAPLAGRVYVLNHRNQAERARIEGALWAFAGTAEGRAYFEKNKLGGYRQLRRGELRAMDPYAEEVRQNLRSR
nr:phosphate/phosphite/phosphonate ABC transporter substrate-binding protein [Geothrix oryzisoli]